MSAAQSPTADDPRSRAARWLAAWDAQGIHRTGTAGDDRGAEWLAREAAAFGVEPAIEQFALDRLDPVAAYLEIDGRRIDAVPVFDAPATGPDGIVGRLGAIGTASVQTGGEIAVAEWSPQAVYRGESIRLRRAGGHAGLVVICTGDRPGMGLLNAEQFGEPYGAPAIHVASEAREAILAAVWQGKSARLVADSRRTAARAANVVVTLGRRDRRAASVRRPRLVVMTPRSSWWQSTAERGGGIVCWLESLRALVVDPPSGEVILTANSGHELGHLGLDDFIARRPGWDRPVDQGGAVWVHYGANIGAAGGALSLVSASDELRALAQRELAGAGRPADVVAPKTLVPSGETRDIHRAGGAYATLVGSNPLFHLPQDRWPDAVDVDTVARVAAAAARMVGVLAG